MNIEKMDLKRRMEIVELNEYVIIVHYHLKKKGRGKRRRRVETT